jgi:predicted deacetylase
MCEKQFEAPTWKISQAATGALVESHHNVAAHRSKT